MNKDIKKKLEEIANSAKEKLDNLAGEAEKVLNNAKEGVYKIAGTIEKKLENREGIIGDIVNAGEKVYDAAKDKNEEIKSRGGKVQVFMDGFDKVASKVDDCVDVAKDKYNNAMNKAEKYADVVTDKISDVIIKADDYLNDLEDKVTTDGKLDRTKMKIMLKDKAQVVKEYGQKGYENLVKIVKDGHASLKEDFRQYVPSKEERETLYAGVGTKYNGLLFREGYDACLQYENVVFGKIPGQLKLKQEILRDNKESASKNKEELKEFYRREFVEDKIPGLEFERRNDIVDKYL